ncbi:methyltransferase small domain protein [Asticcacaulis biprosthecium C19]|uniref:Methyltransferase small domain protein n=1 Tax=Asticcacaulis biprosthecium C19 TaxID=715226 RepID=F4QNP8_9CAUL|nr:methyltransferase [Asticcacaulis biprosthecium]EGF90956.1 methyltransferase small domain protein [Asticcacaulis biprosthecium C19]
MAFDPVLETLCLALSEDVPAPADGPALFLRARYNPALDVLPREAWLCDQSFKPDYDVLVRQGFALREAPPFREDGDGTQYGLVCVLPPRQREEYRALLARAVTETRPGGIVLASVSNLEGAKTVENDLKALCGNVTSLSKNKCRAFWAHVGDGIDRDLVAAWSQLDAPREVEGGLIGRPGLFAWDRIDAGSRLLAENLPKLSGKGADLGAGAGYLSREVLQRCPAVTHLTLFEAESRALPLARQNLASFADRCDFHWHDVTKGVPISVSGPFDFIVMNPPFHTGRADRNDLGHGFIRAAAGALEKGSALWMVANRHLPYEEVLKAAFKTVITVADAPRYKVFKAVK